jgi:hypothetical protein
MRAIRSEVGNLPPRNVGLLTKPITDARPSVGDGCGNREDRENRHMADREQIAATLAASMLKPIDYASGAARPLDDLQRRVAHESRRNLQRGAGRTG